jgi:hypothetical protein
MAIKNRLDKIAAALTQSQWQQVIKIDDRQGATVTEWQHIDGTIYPFDADLSHLKGVNVLFANYAD